MGQDAPKSIDHRDCHHWMEAWEWADAAAAIGWRVVSVTHDGTHWHVFAECPKGSDSEDWELNRDQTGRFDSRKD